MASYSIFRGADKTLKQLANLRAFAPNQFEAALYQEAQLELTEIKRVTPVDTGALRASEGLRGPFRNGRRIWVEVVAGGPSVPYALKVHEDLEADHSHSHNQYGQAKYIENPLRQSAPFMGARVAKRIDLGKAMRGA